MAAVCVGVGVAAVVALQTATLTVQNALTSNVRAANGGDLALSTDAAPLGKSDLATFRHLQSRGLISTWTPVASLHATAVGSNGRLVPFDVQVVSSPPYPLGGQPTFVAPKSGSVEALLAQRGSVLISSVLADELGVSLGNRVAVGGLGSQSLHATVRGILSQTSFEHESVMTVSRRDAGKLSSGPPRYTAVFADSGHPAQAAAALRHAFPTASVQTVQDALTNAQTQVHDFRQFMLLVGLFALLIAGIGTLNAVQSSLATRRVEIAVLKTLGYGSGTLYALFAGEAAVIGLAGGVVGTVVGALASKAIGDALARAIAIQVTFVLDGETLLMGVVLGVGAAVVFAVLPIVRASALRPVEVLRDATGTTPTTWLQTAGLLILTVALFAALASVILGNIGLAVIFVALTALACAVLAALFSLAISGVSRLGPSHGMWPLAVLLLLIALTVLTFHLAPAGGPLVALAALVWAATVVFRERTLFPLIIAVRSLERRRSRTAVTLVALLAGILCMTVTLTVALSLEGQINDALASNGSTNLVVVVGDSGRTAAMAATRRLPGLKERQAVDVIQTRPVSINGRRLVDVIGPSRATGGDEEDDTGRLLGGVTGWDTASGAGPTRISIVSGRSLSRADHNTDHVLLRQELQDPPYGLRLGDRVALREPGSGRRASVTVVGFYDRGRRRGLFQSFFTPPIYADAGFVSRLGNGDQQTIVSMTVQSARLTHDATLLQRSIPGALVLDVADLTAVVERILGELLNLLAVITALVLGAGVAVVATGVTLSMLERRREVALYKTIGFEPSSVFRFILLENALLGTLSGAAAIVVTAISLAILSRFALQQAVGFDPRLAVIVLLIATILVTATASAVAWRPLGVRPIETLRNE